MARDPAHPRRKYNRADRHSTYQLILRAKDVAGLTYDQIAQVFDITASRCQQITLEQRRLVKEAESAQSGPVDEGDGRVGQATP